MEELVIFTTSRNVQKIYVVFNANTIFSYFVIKGNKFRYFSNLYPVMMIITKMLVKNF